MQATWHMYNAASGSQLKADRVRLSSVLCEGWFKCAPLLQHSSAASKFRLLLLQIWVGELKFGPYLGFRVAEDMPRECAGYSAVIRWDSRRQTEI